MNKPKTEVVVKEVMGFSNDGKGTLITMNNAKLIAHTERMQAYMKLEKAGQLGQCYELGQIASDESFKSLGCKSVSEYAERVFGIRPATTSAYARIGQHFVTVDADGKPSIIEGIPQFSVGQLLELLPLYKDGTEEEGKEAVQQFLATGAVGQYSSTKAIRSAVKDYLAIGTTATEVPAESEEKEADKEGKEGKEANKVAEPSKAIVSATSILSEVLKANVAHQFLNDEQTEKIMAICNELNEIAGAIEGVELK